MDNLMLGLATTIIGMLVVFIGLFILIGCIYGMTAITKRSKKALAPTQEKAPAPEAVQAAAADDQLIAVIAAAIAAVWQGDSSSGFVVRRIKRVETSTARARAARDEQIFSRL